MIKAIIATFTGGFVVGVVLLWIEYQIFIPAYSEEEEVMIPAKPSTNIPSTPSDDKIFQDNLRDGGLAPKMVFIPAGRFRMGDIQGKGASWELPVHNVFVSHFAISRYEVTFAEYDLFAEMTNREKPDDEGWGRGNHPVINVSWFDANAYTKWLTQQTGKTYRLPTEAEWEYAARAKTETQYWWGNEMRYGWANCDGCGSRWDNQKTAPVGYFEPNLFDLYDTVGNVYEWTCSEYEEKYSGQEQRCSNTSNIENFRVIRGGSWYSLPGYLRVSSRFRSRVNKLDFTIGFRIVREDSTTD